MTRCPPATRVSLLASATRLPAVQRAEDGGSAAIPVVAPRPRCRRRPPSPAPRGRPAAQRSVGDVAGPRSVAPRARRAGTAASCARKSGLGRRRRARGRRKRVAEPGERPRGPGCRSSRSSRGRRRRSSHDSTGDEERVAGEHRGREEERVDPVEDAAVARETRNPESLRPAARFSIDSARSPTWAVIPTIGPMMSGCHGSRPMSAAPMPAPTSPRPARRRAPRPSWPG